MQTLFSEQTGMIAIDHQGNIGVSHRTPEMPHAFVSSDREITARIRV
ncbi:MAG: hypothetical protein F6K42_27470 [Leptolyngbya sp. SIO1D8]|nr:hypothetical protein [Leptolyngbya sp. SIO1D8]